MKLHLCMLMALCAIIAGCRSTDKNTAQQAENHTHLHSDASSENQKQPHIHDNNSSCSGDHSHKEHDPSEDLESENHNEIVFPLIQQSKTDFAVEAVRKGSFTEVIRTGGQILPAQGDEVTLVSPVSGVVSFAGSNLSDGTQVAKGQKMFYVSSKNIASGDVFSKNAASYRKAKADLQRMESLLEDRIVSQREYDEAKLAYEQAAAEYNAIAGSNSARGTQVSAPIPGFITSLSVNEGDFIEMGQILATVSQNRRLKLRADVSQKYMARLRTISSANITIPYSSNTYKLAELNGKLISSGKKSAEGTTLIPVTFEFDNNNEILPGSYVEVNLLGTLEPDVITLPLSAITEQQGLYYIYVQLDPECFERREVKIGTDDGVRIKILAGISENERVVTKGAVNVKMAAASGAIPHGHEH